MSNALKACPFCGGKAELRHSSLFGRLNEWTVECTRCKTSPSNDWCLSEAEAVDLWNTRIDNTELARQ